jgi:hypothetical protein
MEQSHGVLLVSAPHDTQLGTQVETMLMHFLRGFERHGLFIFDVIVRLFLLGCFEVISSLQRLAFVSLFATIFPFLLRCLFNYSNLFRPLII